VSLEHRVVRSVSWMGSLTAVSQAVSWAVTIIIAHLLLPEDYGLMAMATIITGYALSLSELGLGSAIIQRSELSEEELSSAFWLLTLLAVVLALACVPASYATAWLMSEPRVIPLTQAVSIVFVLTGFQIVPSSLLRKRMDFRAVGSIEMAATLASSVSMLCIAALGGRVWTLLLGSVILAATRTILYFVKARWWPSWHFDLWRCRGLLWFGVTIAGGRTLFYIGENIDKYLAGRSWSPGALGLYSFALSLAQLPTNKIVGLINSVSYPALAEVQADRSRFSRLYLHICKATAAVTLPLYLSGFLLGGEIVSIVLGPKWMPMSTAFQVLCIGQLFTSLNAVNGFAHAASGRPAWSVYYQLCSIPCMGVSFAIGAHFGLMGMVIPWVSTYAVLSVAAILDSLRRLEIPISAYVGALSVPLGATVAFVSAFWVGGRLVAFVVPTLARTLPALMLVGLLASAVYAMCFWVFDHDYVAGLWRLALQREAGAQGIQ
jgi:O-antigen/teichoic acid export membrane protein